MKIFHSRLLSLGLLSATFAGSVSYAQEENLSELRIPAVGSRLTQTQSEVGTMLYDMSDFGVYIRNTGADGSVAGGWTSLTAGNTTASRSSTGTVTSYFPVIASSVNSVSSANYTILDGDGYKDILVSAGAAPRTVLLPAPANNNGRVIQIKKTDSGTNAVTINPNNSETIEGLASFPLTFQYQSVTLACDGTNWHAISYPNKFHFQNTYSSDGTTGDQPVAATTVPYTAIYRITAKGGIMSGDGGGGADASRMSLIIKTGSSSYASATVQGPTTLLTANEAAASQRGYTNGINEVVSSLNAGDSVHLGRNLVNHVGTGSTSDFQLTIEEIKRK